MTKSAGIRAKKEKVMVAAGASLAEMTISDIAERSSSVEERLLEAGRNVVLGAQDT